MNTIMLNLILALNAVALLITAFFPTEFSSQHTVMYCSIIALTTIAMENNKK
jgi:hypothetical protein